MVIRLGRDGVPISNHYFLAIQKGILVQEYNNNSAGQYCVLSSLKILLRIFCTVYRTHIQHEHYEVSFHSSSMYLQLKYGIYLINFISSTKKAEMWF